MSFLKYPVITGPFSDDEILHFVIDAVSQSTPTDLIVQRLIEIGAKLAQADPFEHLRKLDLRIDGFELTGRAARAACCLRWENIVYVGELVQRQPAEILRIPNFGRVSLQEIEDRVLAPLGLCWGMETGRWTRPDLRSTLANVERSG